VFKLFTMRSAPRNQCISLDLLIARLHQLMMILSQIGETLSLHVLPAAPPTAS